MIFSDVKSGNVLLYPVMVVNHDWALHYNNFLSLKIFRFVQSEENVLYKNSLPV